jgi:hypothetical protein
MSEKRALREIESDVRDTRISKVTLKWQPDEIAVKPVSWYS